MRQPFHPFMLFVFAGVRLRRHVQPALLVLVLLFVVRRTSSARFVCWPCPSRAPCFFSSPSVTPVAANRCPSPTRSVPPGADRTATSRVSSDEVAADPATANPCHTHSSGPPSLRPHGEYSAESTHPDSSTAAAHLQAEKRIVPGTGSRSRAKRPPPEPAARTPVHGTHVRRRPTTVARPPQAPRSAAANQPGHTATATRLENSRKPGERRATAGRGAMGGNGPDGSEKSRTGSAVFRA